MNLSSKQLGVLLVVAAKNTDGTSVDLDEVIERQTYETNKPSIQFIIRNLGEKKLIVKTGFEKRRGARRILFETTPLGERYVEWNKRAEDKSLKETLIE